MEKAKNTLSKSNIAFVYENSNENSLLELVNVVKL